MNSSTFWTPSRYLTLLTWFHISFSVDWFENSPRVGDTLGPGVCEGVKAEGVAFGNLGAHSGAVFYSVFSLVR